MANARNVAKPRQPPKKAALPKKGDVRIDDPTNPCPEGGPLTPSQLDRRSPMDDGASPSRLDFEILKGRVTTNEAILRRLLLVLPASAQAEFALLIPEPDAEEGS